MTSFGTTLKQVEEITPPMEVLLKRETLNKLIKDATDKPTFSDNGLLLLSNEKEGIYFFIRVNVGINELYQIIYAEKREDNVYKMVYVAGNDHIRI